MTDSDHICFEAIQFAAATEKGLQDVSILTIGEAKGHGRMVDEQTIQDFMRLSIGKTIPAYLTHEGALDENGRPKDRLGREVGMFSGFYRDGNKVRAKNFQFLEAFKANEPKTYATILEMAKGFSENLGISPVLRHALAWVTGKGEVPAEGGKPAGALNDLPAMRLRDLLSCDFVTKPAANLGLFEAKIDATTTTNSSTMSADTILLSKHTEEVTSLQSKHNEAISALETKHKDAVAALEAKVTEHVSALAKKDGEITALNATLAAKTKEAEEAAKYDMRKAGAPALTVALQAHNGNIPVPAEGAKDSDKWAQYSALCEEVKDANGNLIAHKETANARKFRETYLVRK